MNWRIMICGKDHPYHNMAIDEAIYREVTAGNSPPTIRLYDWQPASFSCGFNQQIEKELDLNLVLDSEYSYVRRPTGGRVVLHEDEVTYAVIAPLTERFSGSISEVNLSIGKALAKGLALAGVEVDISNEIQSRDFQRTNVNPCFTSSSKAELNYQRKKIVGSAQTRNAKAFLQHGSILRNKNQERVADFLPMKSDSERLRMKRFLSQKTISVSNILDKSIDFDFLSEKIILGFIDSWEEDFFYRSNKLSQKELSLVNELFIGKYVTSAWNDNKITAKFS